MGRVLDARVMLTAKEIATRRALRPPSRYTPPHESQNKMFDKQTRHNDLVTRITRMPRVDQYASVSRDDPCARGPSTNARPADGDALRKKVNVGVGFLNDAAELPVTGRLAVACFDRSLRVFDPKAWTETGAYRALKDVRRCAPPVGRAGSASPGRAM